MTTTELIQKLFDDGYWTWTKNAIDEPCIYGKEIWGVMITRLCKDNTVTKNGRNYHKIITEQQIIDYVLSTSNKQLTSGDRYRIKKELKKK